MKPNMLKFFVTALGLGMLFIVSASFVCHQLKGDPWDIPEKYQKMKNPVSPTPETNAVGQALYKKHCASCHGKTGKGDGRRASEMDTPMEDLGRQEYKDRLPGIKYYQSFIGRGEMPNFEKKIPDEEDRWSLINFMDTF